MNQKLLLTLTLLGILTLSILAISKPTQEGIVKSIQTSQNKITIHLEKFTPELILFQTSYTTLQKGDKIKFSGRPDTYKNKEQIIVDKITKLNY